MDKFKEIFGHPVDVIALHKDAHSDELLASFMLQEFGEPVFPGIKKARVIFLNAMPKGKDWRDLFFKEKTLTVGIGFGPYDEHLSNGMRIPDHCAATLVAESLDLLEDASLKGLLAFTFKRDREVGDNNYELPALIKTMWRAARSEHEILQWAYLTFRSIHATGINFWEVASNDFRRATVLSIPVAGCKKNVRFAAGISNSKEFGKYARSSHGGYCGIVVFKNPAGEVVVQTSKDLKIDLSPTVAALRMLELKAANKAALSVEKLSTPGSIPECPEWFFFETGGSILTGRGEKSRLPWGLITSTIQKTQHPDWIPSLKRSVDLAAREKVVVTALA